MKRHHPYLQVQIGRVSTFEADESRGGDAESSVTSAALLLVPLATGVSVFKCRYSSACFEAVWLVGPYMCKLVRDRAAETDDLEVGGWPTQRPRRSHSTPRI